MENDKLISANRLKETIRSEQRIQHSSDLSGRLVEYLIDKAPAEECAPVVHGRWLYAGLFDDFAKCSVCGIMEFSLFEAHKHHYCFNCGAKMDIQ